jgi:hypothetical protein
MDGVRDETSVAVEEGEVHAPRVETDAFQIFGLSDGLRQRALYLVEEAERVPVEGSGGVNRDVREAVDLTERHPLAVESGEERAPALRAEIRREEFRRRAHGSTGYAIAVMRERAGCVVSIRECCTVTGASDSTRTAYGTPRGTSTPSIPSVRMWRVRSAGTSTETSFIGSRSSK